MKEELPLLLEQFILDIFLGEIDPETGAPPVKNWPRHRALMRALFARLNGKLNVPGDASPDELRAIASFIEQDERGELDRHKLQIFWSYMIAYEESKPNWPTITKVREVHVNKFGSAPESFSIKRTLSLLQLPILRRKRGRPR